MKLVVGLGNPGFSYVGTRHNIGFEVVDVVAEKLGWVGPGEFDRLARSRFDGLCFEGTAETADGAEKVLLLKPGTFMNNSGRAVQAARAFYKVEPKDILIVVDEVNLPVGKLRLRGNGSDGGHNGLRDIRRVLGTTDYPRLRVGVDPAPPRVPQKDYVLGKFSPEQRQAVDAALPRAASCVMTWIDQGLIAAMNAFNAAAAEKARD